MKASLHISDTAISLDDLEKNIMVLPQLVDWQISVKTFLEKWFSQDTHFDLNTSGSTGDPKLIRVSREDLLRSARYTLNFLKLDPGMTILHCLPVEFVAGKMMLLRSLVGRLNCYVVKPRVNPLLDVNYNVDFIALTPHQLHSILQHPDSTKKLNAIRTVIIGGAALLEEDRKRLSQMDPESYLTYGMTETLTHIAMSRLKGFASLGAFNLIHEDFAIEVSERGTLIIKSPYNHAKSIETNDVVELTSDVSFFLKGRSDNVINSGGIKIHPEKIETVLSEYIKATFFIAGLESESLGQELTLFVEMEDSSEESKRDLEKIVKETKLDHRYKPKNVVLIPKFVYTASGKIDRNKTMSLRRG